MANTAYGYGSNASGRRATGLMGVVVFHALLIYALVTGLAQDAVKKIQQKVEVAIISEPPPPPPPPPPPKVEKVVQKVAPQPQQPKAYVPPVEHPQPQAAPAAIAATTSDPAPQPPVQAPVAVAPPPAPSGPLSARGNCSHLEQPEYPNKAQEDGIEGLVSVVFNFGSNGKFSGLETINFKGIPASYRSQFKSEITKALQSYVCPAGSFSYEYNFHLNADS